MLHKKIAEYPLVAIEWDDAETDVGWQNREDHVEPTDKLAYTVGYLIKKTANHIVIASTVGMDGSTNNRIQIPYGMVKKLTDVTVGKKKKRVSVAGIEPATSTPQT